MEAYPQVTYSLVFPGAIDREHEGSCKAGHMMQCIFSSLFPSIDDSFTSQLSMCPAQLPLSFQINPLQPFLSFQIQSNELFWFEFQSHQFWLLNPIVCLNYLPFGGDMHILILLTYQNFQSNPYFTLQSLSFTFKEVHYFFLRNFFIICFHSWSSFVCFWWSAILCFWGRVCLHSPEYPGTLYVNHTCCKQTDPPTSAFHVLELKLCTITLTSNLNFIYFRCCRIFFLISLRCSCSPYHSFAVLSL